MRPIYITTPIYYVNGEPHIGHAYTTIAADVLARYHRLRGRAVRFVTGTDEHGQKIERKAREEGLSPRAFVDRLVPIFRETWEMLDCEPDDFIRTTEKRHESFVQALWKRCAERGDIYLGHYEGWYSVIDEAFFTDKDVVDGRVRDTGHPVERVREPSYFFRLSRYEKQLLEFYESHPRFVEPEGRFNEIKSFVRQGLEDLSISRTSFRWGIPVPGAQDHVIYVWFDALANYLSALGGLAEAPLARFWEPEAEVIHLIGKEIVRFHAVYWPAFLMSAGLPLPTRIFAHGWMTVNGAKMSKSAGNFLTPGPLVQVMGSDALRFYLMRDVPLGSDSDFNHLAFLQRYHGDLSNGLGNLAQRLIRGIVSQALDGRIPRPPLGRMEDIDRLVVEKAMRASEEAASHYEDIAPHRALEAIWQLVGEANRYLDRTEPWSLLKRGQRERLEVVVFTALEALRWLSILLWPVMPKKCDALRAQLGLPAIMPIEGLDAWPKAWGGIGPELRTRPGEALFPRLEENTQKAFLSRFGLSLAPETPDASSKASKALSVPTPPSESSKPAQKGTIRIEDFEKIEMRLGLILEATRVEGSDKLLELKVDVGEAEARTILAGIAEHYAPEELIGRRIVVVTNLEPRKFARFGKTSYGMVLAAKDDHGLSVLSPDKAIAQGAKVS
ncbi:MAG: methionine--tRNA ligase [Sandaracinaceae bacterium]|nr:methionine--tRNA ligase [Sandaracinaceae bacterium]